MEDESAAEHYIIVPSCYIKEELDISNIADEYDDETYYTSNYVVQTTSDAIDEQGVNADMVYQDMINQAKVKQSESNGNTTNEHPQICIKKEKKESIPMEVDKENTESPEKIEEKSNSSGNNHIAIMGEESDDTDVDVENTSSDDESITKSSRRSLQREHSNITGDSTRENESSEDEDFELKISDEDGDKVKSGENSDTQNTSKNKVKDKIHANDSNNLDSSESEIKTYITRNKSKNQMSTSQIADMNSSNITSESKQSNYQTVNDKIVTRYSLKGPEEKLQERTKFREKRSIKVNDAMTGYCLNCLIEVELTSCKNGNPCPKCKKDVKFKCTKCKNKNHMTDTYCGMHKHVQFHHLKKQEKYSKNNKVDSQKSLEENQKGKMNKRELVLQDIEKFTILICLQCNKVARVYNGKISDCGGCKVKMVLTCLICSQYEASVHGMHEHLRQQHKEHVTKENHENQEKNKTNISEGKPCFVSKKRCLKCSKRFLSSGSAYKHAATCTQEPRVYSCNHCSYSTLIHGNLKKHCLNEHNKDVESNPRITKTETNSRTTAAFNNQCQVCGKVILKLESLKNHQKYCGIEPNIQCQFCSYKTKYKGNLNSHINQYHKTKSKGVITPESSKTKVTSTVQETSLISYISDKGKPNDIKANGNLSSILIVKPLNEVAEAICLKCNEYYEMFVTSKERQCNNCGHLIIYRCLICQKPYELYQSLMYHLDSTCNPKKRYECKKCDYKTYVNNTMQKHLRIHGIGSWNWTWSKGNKRGINLDGTNEFVKVVKFPVVDSKLNNKSDLKTTTTNKPEIRTEPENIAKAQLPFPSNVNELEESPSVSQIQNPNLKSKCPKCQRCMVSLKKHLLFCGVEANMKCKFCPYKTKYKFNLKVHMKSCSKGKMVNKKLKDFNMKAQTKIETKVPNSIAAHKFVKRIDSPQLKAEDLMQSYCFKCDATKEAMKYASKCRVCESQLTYRCAKCNMESPTREELRLHVRLHWSKPYNCSKCPKAFGHIENLRSHEKVCTMTGTTTTNT